MTLSTLLLCSVLHVSPPALAGDEPTLEQRLEKLTEDLERARVDAHVPGLSIAVVKDGEVILARGLGLADVEGERAAEAATIYAIGSTTKAFTATLIGTLVDEGTLGWDDPVTRFLPWFDLQVKSDDPEATCTLRDLLSHRHGFTRMGLLWSSGDVPRETILRTAAKAEPFSAFRKEFHYCNVAFLAAGVAAGEAAGSTWDELMVERLIEPLGMTSTTLTKAAAEKDEHLAKGYRWSESDETLERRPMVELECVGPAGSVNASVLDMAHWVRLQLGRGEVDGLRLISEQSLAETWKPQIEIGGGVSYGMGWMLREHDGRRVVEHGGNIDGFSAEVGLMPEENLGFVLLTNLDATPLQQTSIGIVFDALLDDWRPPAGSVAAADGAIDYDELVGTYIANFATFRDEAFEVRRTEAGLALHIPSQMTFDLKAPDEDGRWVFALTDQVAVTFDRDDAGRLVGLSMHQAGYRFEVPREGVEVEPEVPPETLEKFLGTYVRDNGGKQVEIVLQDGRLAIVNRDQIMTFETPDEGGHAPLRARADQGATFEVDAEGQVASFVFHGDAGDQLFTRLADSGSETLPTLDEVLALRKVEARIAALGAAGGSRVTGKVRLPQAGLEGDLTILTRGADRLSTRMDFGPFGRIDVAVLGDQAWRSTPMRGLEPLKGVELAQALLEHPAAVEGDWRDYYESIEVTGREELDGRATLVLRLRHAELPPRTYWVDAEHGDVLQVKSVVVESGFRLPVTTTYSDFVERDGLRQASRVELANDASGRTVMTFEAVETGLELGDEAFRLEAR